MLYRIYFLGILAVLNCARSFAQHYESFSSKLQLKIFLDVTEENTFRISTQIGGKQKGISDNRYGITLSIGDAIVQNDTLILVDIQSGYKWYLKDTKKGYKVLEGLPSLINDKFVKTSAYTFVMFKLPQKTETLKSIAQINKTQGGLISILPGEYWYYLCMTTQYVPRYNGRLIIKKNFSYEYYLKDILISTGTITQCDEWLLLQDNVFKMDFFARVCDSGSFASVTLPIYNQQKCSDICKFKRYN